MMTEKSDRSPVAFANTLLEIASKEGVRLTPLKMQKLLYISYGYHLTKMRGPILPDIEFEAWRLGPVERTVYNAFRDYGGGEIKKLTKSPDGIIYVIHDDDIEASASITQTIVDYGKLTAAYLVNMTHRKNGAWEKVWQDGAGKGEVLTDASIKEEFVAYDF